MLLKLLENGGSRFIDNVADCRFSRAPTPHVTFRRTLPCGAENALGEEERVDLFGDAYVLNAHGDTIDRFKADPRKEGIRS